MERKKLEELEALLLELRKEIGAPFIVIPEYMEDGTWLAVYDKEGKEPIFQKGAPDLNACLDAYYLFSGRG
jgi:hypothetical protein